MSLLRRTKLIKTKKVFFGPPALAGWVERFAKLIAVVHNMAVHRFRASLPACCFSGWREDTSRGALSSSSDESSLHQARGRKLFRAKDIASYSRLFPAIERRHCGASRCASNFGLKFASDSIHLDRG
jgi:hypothetical protein